MTTHDGFWNGQPAKFRIVHVLIGEEPEQLKKQLESARNGRKIYLWFTPFLGDRIQAVQVFQGSQDFFMANEDGTALYKVTKGQGSPQYGHRSVYPSQVINEAEQSEWIHYSKEAAISFDNRVNDMWMQIDPTGYPEHLKAVRALQEKIMELNKQKFN